MRAMAPSTNALPFLAHSVPCFAQLCVRGLRLWSMPPHFNGFSQYPIRAMAQFLGKGWEKVNELTTMELIFYLT